MKHYYYSIISKDYIYKGLALYNSLNRWDGNFHFFMVCLQDEVANLLKKMSLKNTTFITLSDIESEDTELLRVKTSRNDKEYIWTSKASTGLYIFNHFPEVDHIVWLDGDTYFFSRPDPIFQEWGDYSIMLTEERWREKHKCQNLFKGIYNTGFIGFKRDKNALECLNWFRDRLLEWCFDKHENGLWSDQLHVNDWPERFQNVGIIKNIGINIGSYIIQSCKVEIVCKANSTYDVNEIYEADSIYDVNRVCKADSMCDVSRVCKADSMYDVSRVCKADSMYDVNGEGMHENIEVYVDNHKLVFFHFYGFNYYDGNVFDLSSYPMIFKDNVIKWIYVPYIYSSKKIMEYIFEIDPNFYELKKPEEHFIGNYFNLSANTDNEMIGKECLNLCAIVTADHLSKSIAIYSYFKKGIINFHLWICCLDTESYNLLKGMDLKNSTLISLKNFKDKQLYKLERKLEFHDFMQIIKVSFIIYLLKNNYNLNFILYTDSDVPLDVLLSKNTASFKRNKKTFRYLRWWKRKCIINSYKEHKI